MSFLDEIDDTDPESVSQVNAKVRINTMQITRIKEKREKYKKLKIIIFQELYIIFY